MSSRRARSLTEGDQAGSGSGSGSESGSETKYENTYIDGSAVPPHTKREQTQPTDGGRIRSQTAAAGDVPGSLISALLRDEDEEEEDDEEGSTSTRKIGTGKRLQQQDRSAFPQRTQIESDDDSGGVSDSYYASRAPVRLSSPPDVEPLSLLLNSTNRNINSSSNHYNNNNNEESGARSLVHEGPMEREMVAPAVPGSGFDSRMRRSTATSSESAVNVGAGDGALHFNYHDLEIPAEDGSFGRNKGAWGQDGAPRRSRSETDDSNASIVVVAARDKKRASEFSEDSFFDGHHGAGDGGDDGLGPLLKLSQSDGSHGCGCYRSIRRLFLSCVRHIPLSSAQRRFLWRAFVTLILLALIAIPSVLAARQLSSAPDSVTIVGMGDTAFAGQVYESWFSSYSSDEDKGLLPAVTGTTLVRFTTFSGGPGEAVESIVQGEVDYASLDLPGNGTASGAIVADSPPLYSFPALGGSIGLIYNRQCLMNGRPTMLPTGLILSQEALPSIFDGSVSSWNDPEITKNNPSLNGSGFITMEPGHFTASSGETYIFTRALSSMSPAWASKYSYGYALQKWDIYAQNDAAIRSSSAMLQWVLSTNCSIGYVSISASTAALVTSNSSLLSVARIVNGFNEPIAPTLDALQLTVTGADNAATSNSLNIVLENFNCSGCYPIAGYSYITLAQDGTQSDCRYKLKAFHDFWSWAFTGPEALSAATQAYTVLPTATHQTVVLSALISSIQCNGLTVTEWEDPTNDSLSYIWAVVLAVEVGLCLCGLLMWQVIANRRAKHKIREIQREVRRRARTVDASTAPENGKPREETFRVQQVNARADLMRSQIGQDELTLLKQIGSGAFGEVYLGRFRGTKVAIKRQLCSDTKNTSAQSRQDEKFQEFLAEASLLARLRHPNIVQFLGATMKPPHLYIVTEFCSRGALSDTLFEGDRYLSPTLRLKFCADTAQGMNYLHTHNPPIVHRDLKTQNLLVTSNWDVKVADFGISRVVDDTKTMTYCGTVHICAPEVIANQRYSEKADIFSFAIVMWEIWTRSDIWPGLSMFQIMEAVVDRDVRPPIDNIVRSLSDAKTTRTRKDRQKQGSLRDDPVPRQIDELMQRCWMREPLRRPSFAEILDDLREIRRGSKGGKVNAAGAVGVFEKPSVQAVSASNALQQLAFSQAHNYGQNADQFSAVG